MHFDFIQNLSAMKTLPNHDVINYPLDSSSFLGALRWWSSSLHLRDVMIRMTLWRVLEMQLKLLVLTSLLME